MEEGSGNVYPTVPPPLPYSLRDRKLSITIFWSLFLLDTLVQPLVLYWVLWYATDISHNLVFSIVTACLGGMSVFEYFYRLFNLFRKNSRARPLNAKKSWLDFFQINFTIVWCALAVELIVGTVQHEPYVRLIAMILPTVMFYFGGVYLSLDILRVLGFKAPFRISSTPRGSTMPTALYVLIEDVVAVDGGGGQKYRYALRTRYLSSPYFRRMLFEMNCFWAGGAIVIAASITAIVFTVSRPVAFTIGWAMPFAWAALWTLITIPWVQADLRREKKWWSLNRAQVGITYTDDLNAPIPRTRFESVQHHVMPWSVTGSIAKRKSQRRHSDTSSESTPSEPKSSRPPSFNSGLYQPKSYEQGTTEPPELEQRPSRQVNAEQQQPGEPLPEPDPNELLPPGPRPFESNRSPNLSEADTIGSDPYQPKSNESGTPGFQPLTPKLTESSTPGHRPLEPESSDPTILEPQPSARSRQHEATNPEPTLPEAPEPPEPQPHEHRLSQSASRDSGLSQPKEQQ